MSDKINSSQYNDNFLEELEKENKMLEKELEDIMRQTEDQKKEYNKRQQDFHNENNLNQNEQKEKKGSPKQKRRDNKQIPVNLQQNLIKSPRIMQSQQIIKNHSNNSNSNSISPNNGRNKNLQEIVEQQTEEQASYSYSNSPQNTNRRLELEEINEESYINPPMPQPNPQHNNSLSNRSLHQHHLSLPSNRSTYKNTIDLNSPQMIDNSIISQSNNQQGNYISSNVNSMNNILMENSFNLTPIAKSNSKKKIRIPEQMSSHSAKSERNFEASPLKNSLLQDQSTANNISQCNGNCNKQSQVEIFRLKQKIKSLEMRLSGTQKALQNVESDQKQKNQKIQELTNELEKRKESSDNKKNNSLLNTSIQSLQKSNQSNSFNSQLRKKEKELEKKIEEQENIIQENKKTYKRISELNSQLLQKNKDLEVKIAQFTSTSQSHTQKIKELQEQNRQKQTQISNQYIDFESKQQDFVKSQTNNNEELLQMKRKISYLEQCMEEKEIEFERLQKYTQGLKKAATQHLQSTEYFKEAYKQIVSTVNDLSEENQMLQNEQQQQQDLHPDISSIQFFKNQQSSRSQFQNDEMGMEDLDFTEIILSNSNIHL